MNVEEKERLIKKDIESVENRVRHAFNQGYEMGLKESRSENPNTCGDAISRQAMLDAFWKLNVELSPTAIWTIQNMVKDVPSVSPQQRTGRWIERESGTEDKENGFETVIVCSYCDFPATTFYSEDCESRTQIRTDFCPNCGAKMEVEE